LLDNTSSKNIIVALQKINYDITSVKQMTAKRPSPEGGVSLFSLPFFLVTLAKESKSSRNNQIDISLEYSCKGRGLVDPKMG
jgi:hypothetical protein